MRNIQSTGRSAAVDVHMLGPFEVHGADGPVTIGSRKQRRLLAALAVHAGSVVSTDRLIDILWGQAPPPSALNSLQTYVARLRSTLRAIAGELSPIVLRAPGYLLDVDPAQIDAYRFEWTVRRARRQAGADPQGAAHALEQALGWWRGAALVEFADEEFARAAANRWDELRLEGVELRAQALLDLGRNAQAVVELEGHVASHPLREEGSRLLMLALSRAGRGPDALDVYRRFRTLVNDELGLDPSARLQQLERDILTGSSAAAPTAPAQGNLAVPASSFVGRQRDRSEIVRMLGHHRVVTITGPGGVGKTALALHTAAAAAPAHPDGTWLCELARVRTAGAIPHVIAAALGLVLQAEADATRALIAALGARRLLLVLDNCEHQLDAAAHVVDAITRHCPGITVLSTSRERLNLASEHVWPLGPLDVPGDAPEHAQRSPAVTLFVERAQAVGPGFRITEHNIQRVADVCRGLDGLPLALELAAARLGALTLDDIAARLGDRLDLLSQGQRTAAVRHRSLRAVVDWSYGLLSGPERMLFRRLSVFAGGFTLDQAEAVCADRHLPVGQIVTLLAALVDQSMVVRPNERGRYALLETLRAYAQERLHEHGEATAFRQAHARRFVAFAEAAAEGLAGSDETAWFERTEADVDNLRVAHQWAVDHNDSDTALRISVALHRFGFWRMRYEVLGWAQAAASIDSASRHPLFGVALASAGVAAWTRGDLAHARTTGEHAVRAAREQGMPHEVLGDVALFDGRPRDADDLYRAAARRYRTAGDVQSEVWALASQALSCSYAGLDDQAVSRATETAKVAHGSPNPTTQALALYAEGECLLDQHPDRALAVLARSRGLAESSGNAFLAGVVEVSIASVLGRHGEPDRALRAFREVIARWRRTGNWMQQWTTLRNLATLLVRLGEEELAAVFFGAASSESVPSAYGPEARRLEQTRAALEAQVGSATLRDLVTRGQKMRGEECVALASREIDRLLG